jgi:CRISPR/Cas system-associated endonuclease/helicase Cas3
MDISFVHLYDSVCSPESSLQRLGRTNRWGDYQKYSPGVTFMDLSDEKTEGAAIRTVYNKDLQKKWYAFLKNALCNFSEVDLRTLYKIYNKFYHSYRSDMIEYLKEQYRVGMHGYKAGMEFLGLIGFYPIKVLNSDPERKEKKQHKNLRNPDGSYFYTVELIGKPNQWLPPEDVLSEGYELHDRYEKNGKLTLELLNSGAMLTRLKGLVACGYTGWRRQSKGVVPTNMKTWFYKARDPETPLPDFSRRYDSVLGVIKF